jgi:alpha-D-ribose 1-methylphosphonate 5-triphosphate synthase subunit PhnH
MSLELPGFAAPVLQAQAAFRAVLEAMSRPGQRQSVGTTLTPPAPLSLAAAAVLLTLADADTVLHLADDTDCCAEWVQFHTGTRLGPVDAADFVLARTLPDLATLAQGTDDAPELGATVILEVDGLGFDGLGTGGLGTGQSFRLSGPGLKAPALFTVSGLPADFARRWRHNRGSFPRGVDLILCHGTEIVAFPRSLTVMEA